MSKPDVEMRLGQNSCLECTQRRHARALFTYVNLISEEVVEVPYGWATAKCVDGEPVEWLCLHNHQSKDDAEACLTETFGRGDCAVSNPDEQNVNS